MAVVAVVGILATIAANMYSRQITAANRTEARSALQTSAGTLEKCKSLYGTYNHANCNYADFQTESGYYNVAVAIPAAGTTYTLTATRVGGSRQSSDGDCGDFTLTNTGVEGVINATLPAIDCW